MPRKSKTTYRVNVVPEPTATPDPVNHPSHYNSHPSGIECIQVVRWFGFNLGNAIKYIWRSEVKDRATQIQDLKKARWYLDDEITRLEGITASQEQLG